MSIASFLERIRLQSAALWEFESTDGDGYHRFSSASPTEIECRWEDVVMTDVSVEGQTLNYKSMVILDRDVVEGGFLKLGEVDSATPLDPLEDDDAHEILKVERIPDIKNETTVIFAYL